MEVDCRREHTKTQGEGKIEKGGKEEQRKKEGKKVESERQSGWENPTCTHVHKV